MREILFRGKRADTGEWVEGFFICEPSTEWSNNCVPKIYIPVGEHCGKYEIVAKTLGQFTGLRDKNGRRIFEGDILQYMCKVDATKGFKCKDVVNYKPPQFCLGEDDLLANKGETAVKGDEIPTEYYNFEIIGNIHEANNKIWDNKKKIGLKNETYYQIS